MELWSIIGKAAVVVTVLTGVFKLVHWLRSPKEKLLAGVMPQAFKLPPTVDQEVASIRDKAREAEQAFFRKYPKKADGYDKLHAHAEEATWQVLHGIPDTLSYETRSIAGCWYAKVENKGKKKCNDVSLHLPHAILAQVQRDSDLSPQITTIRGVAEIGELRPKAHCNVVAWAELRVDNHDLRDVHLTHEEGVGKVNGSWQTNRIGFICGNLLDRNVLIPLFVLPLAILVLAASLMSLLEEAAKQAQKRTQQPTPTPSVSATPSR